MKFSVTGVMTKPNKEECSQNIRQASRQDIHVSIENHMDRHEVPTKPILG